MDTDKAWKVWGEKNPFYGVLSDNRFRGQNLTKDLEGEFFQSGKAHWESITDICDRLYGNWRKGRAVDFGCGVGRVLLPMSRDFEHTIGIDVSPHMLAIAATNSPNSQLIASDDSLSRLAKPNDMVHSVIVLQHIPPERGLRYINLLLGSLAPGGLAALHFTLKRPQSITKRAVYFFKHNIPAARAIFNILQRKPLAEPLMQMNEYDLSLILKEFQDQKMENVFLLPSTVGETLAVMAFARKADC